MSYLVRVERVELSFLPWEGSIIAVIRYPQDIAIVGHFLREDNTPSFYYSTLPIYCQCLHPTFHPEPQHSPVSLVGAGTAVAQLGYGNCTAFWVWC